MMIVSHTRTILPSDANVHSQHADALGVAFGGDDMQHGLDGKEIGEVEAADKFRGPFLDIEHTDIVSEQTELSAFEGVFPAKAAEVIAKNVATESMTVGSQQSKVGGQSLLGISPCRRQNFWLGV